LVSTSGFLVPMTCLFHSAPNLAESAVASAIASRWKRPWASRCVQKTRTSLRVVADWSPSLKEVSCNSSLFVVNRAVAMLRGWMSAPVSAGNRNNKAKCSRATPSHTSRRVWPSPRTAVDVISLMNYGAGGSVLNSAIPALCAVRRVPVVDEPPCIS